MKKIIIILIIIYSPNLIACDCKDFTIEYEEQVSDLIFIGEIKESNDKYFEIKIVELFKEKIDK